MFTAALVLGSSLSAFSWGQKGHDTVAFIAEQHLTPTTLKSVEKLLDGKSIVYYANWMDNASHTPEYAYSKTWHYKNVDPDETFENAPLLKEGDVVRAIREQALILNDTTRSDEERALALKMVVHFVGDIHQPMHIGRRNDRGGNQWNVKYFRSPSNLHSVWDSKLVESAHKWSYTEWQQQIDRASEEQQFEIIKDGTPEKWGKECHEIHTQIYATTPQDTNIEYTYIANWTPVIEQQFLRGGLRLADLLNSIFDSNYNGSNNIIK